MGKRIEVPAAANNRLHKRDLLVTVAALRGSLREGRH